MKLFVGCVVTLFVATSAFAELSKDEVKRLNEAATVLSELRNVPDNDIPQDLWNRAECVVVIPSLKKAAFVIGGEYGSGVMSCRHGNSWSAPMFMQLAKGSLGFQIGAEEIDLVLLVMNDGGVQKLLQDKVTLGADASVAAGPVGRTANAATDAKLTAEMLAYSRSKGAFAGINLSGGVLRPDKDANANAYGTKLTPHDIAMGTSPVAVPAAAQAWITSLRRDVRATTGVK